jgi:isoleucyl-tRNA synthetase
MKAIASWIAGLDASQIQAFESNNGAAFEINGEPVILTLDDVEIQTKDVPGWAVATDGPLSIALDVALTTALKAEGTAREVVNRVQNARKEDGFDVTDRIVVNYWASEEVLLGIQQYADYLSEEVLAEDLCFITKGEEFNHTEDIVATQDLKFTLIKCP